MQVEQLDVERVNLSMRTPPMRPPPKKKFRQGIYFAIFIPLLKVATTREHSQSAQWIPFEFCWLVMVGANMLLLGN
jgi:hypothetical protein